MSEPIVMAFPRTGTGNAGVAYDVPPQDGMTLRDYFAAQAMLGIVSNDKCMQELMRRDREFDLTMSVIACVADRSFQYADAMLAAREVGKP